MLVALSPEVNCMEQSNFNVTPARRHFTFHLKLCYVSGSIKATNSKNTTYQNVIMCYLDLIFLNCTAVLPLTVFLTFKSWFRLCMAVQNGPLHAGLPLYAHPCIYWKTVGSLLITDSSVFSYFQHFSTVTNCQTWATIVTLPTVSQMERTGKTNGTRDLTFCTAKETL